MLSHKKIAILVCGQIRNSNLGNESYCNDNTFSNDFKKYIINESNLSEYYINIFFSVNNINKNKLNDLCGNNLKGLIELDYEFADPEIDINQLKNNYYNYYNNRKNNPEKYPLCKTLSPRDTYVYKFYKVYCAYKLMINYENKNNIRHDYILLLRPDNSFNYPINFNYIIENNLELMNTWDHIFLGKYNIMCHYCNLVFCYGIYNLGEKMYKQEYVSNIIPPNDNYNYYTYINKWSCWSESPEVQTVEHIVKYCIENNINFDKLNSSILKNLGSVVETRKNYE